MVWCRGWTPAISTFNFRMHAGQSLKIFVISPSIFRVDRSESSDNVFLQGVILANTDHYIPPWRNDLTLRLGILSWKPEIPKVVFDFVAAVLSIRR